MKLLFITVFAVLGVSVCPGQTLADILNSQYDDNPIPTVPVEYTLPRLAAKAPFVQLFNSLLLATGHRVFHSDEYEADEYILMRIKAEDGDRDVRLLVSFTCTKRNRLSGGCFSRKDDHLQWRQSRALHSYGGNEMLPVQGLSGKLPVWS